jgi:hypothetical protein
MARKITWKIWLIENKLTKNVKNDYIAEVSTSGNTLRNEDIAQSIITGRRELRYETILSILSERDDMVGDSLLAGSSFQDKNFHYKPRIAGAWIGSNSTFNAGEHKITVDTTPTIVYRKRLDEEVAVEVLGVKTDGGANIGLVTDLTTGKTDGTITPSGDIVITGDKMKIAPDDEEGLGIFFIDAAGTEIPLDHPMSENNPKKILCRVPASLTDGEYTLKIITRYAGSGTLLKETRTIVYTTPLTVGDISGNS